MEVRKREIPTIFWLAGQLKMDARKLFKVLAQVRSNPMAYLVISKRKRGGGKRKICIPSKPLRRIQRKINRHILMGLRPARNVYGFSGGNVLDAIEPHLGAKSMLFVDFVDAFPTVLDDGVVSILTEGREAYYTGPWPHSVVEQEGFMSWRAARIIADLATFAGRLPQGAPTSPRIFDQACKGLDQKLSALAERIGGHCTRYADNVFFSMNQEEFPPKVRNAVLRIIRRGGFRPHKVRTRKMDKGAIRILGLNIIEGKIHNTRAFKRRLRLAVHHLGWLLEHGMKDTVDFERAWQSLQGKMGFARKDTLPPKLLNSYLELEERIEELTP